MRIMSNSQATMISLLCGVVFTATSAVAQTTTSPSTSAPNAQTQTKQKASPSASQSDGFFKSILNLPTQAKAGFKPAVGGTVPHDVKLHPMPSEAAKALPQAKNHHVAKTSDNTAVIADPKTRKIVGVVSSKDTTASTAQKTPAKQTTQAKQTQTKQTANSSATQSDGFFKGLVSLPMQSKAGFKPSVGGTVPHDVKLHPMPSEAAKALPQAKDHHVAKMDGNTAVIADPKTRKIVGVVSSKDTTASTKGSDSAGSGTKNSK